MSSINTLTSLTRARSWAGVTTTNDDSTINSLISEVSRFILNYLGRSSLFDSNYIQNMDGFGQHSIVLRNWPVTRITQLCVNELSIPEASNALATGYVLEKWDGASCGAQQRLGLRGYCYSRGMSNIAINYTAGYKILSEAQTIHSSGATQITANVPYGNWGADSGVTYSDGSTLTAVSSSPSHGQYSVNAGIYNFASTDAGLAVRISYSYIPADIEHACIALVAERYRYRTRIGEISKSLGGQETMSYSQKDMPEFVRALLQPYRRVF